MDPIDKAKNERQTDRTALRDSDVTENFLQTNFSFKANGIDGALPRNWESARVSAD